MKKIISAAVCGVLAISLAACGTNTITGKYDDISRDVVIKTEHYDPTEFYSMCETMETLIAEGSEEEAFELYGQMYNEIEQICSISDLLGTKYAEDVNNTEVMEEAEYSDNLFEEMSEAMYKEGNLLATAFGENFRDYLDNDTLYDIYVRYSPASEGVLELEKRDSELVGEYYSLYSQKNDYIYNYGGKEYSLKDLEDKELCEKLGDDAVEEIKAGCLKSLNADIGEVFLEMVQIRDEIAEMYGYDSYADYADVNKYFRDYDREDLNAFYEAVKPVGYLCKEIDNTEGYWPDTGDKIADTAEVVEKLVTKLPKSEQKSFKYLIDKRLLVSGSGDQYMSGGYTTPIPSTDSALIYMKYTGSDSIKVLSHELGHFTNFLRNGCNPLNRNILDIAEIHSSGTEALLLDQYDLVFSKEDAQKAKAIVLNGLLSLTKRGCVYDEWQREVYDNPDMTLDEINESFRQISMEYGYDDTDWLEYNWINKAHSFNVPMYYISYATSGIVALQMYEIAKTDREAAIDAWEYILDCGVTANYTETVEGAGLIPFTDTENVKEIYSSCADEMNEILAKYQ